MAFMCSHNIPRRMTRTGRKCWLTSEHEVRSIIRAVLVDGREGATPSPRQRQLLAREIGALSVDVKFALLIDSRFSRGALMALSWISGRGDKMRAFPTARTEDAMLFLGLSTHARERVYEVLKRQRGSAISQAG